MPTEQEIIAEEIAKGCDQDQSYKEIASNILSALASQSEEGMREKVAKTLCPFTCEHEYKCHNATDDSPVCQIQSRKITEILSLITPLIEARARKEIKMPEKRNTERKDLRKTNNDWFFGQGYNQALEDVKKLNGMEDC